MTGPCSDGGWGATEMPQRAVHVRVGGDDITGDGSTSAPFRTVDQAWSHVVENLKGNGRIAVGPGDFDTRVVIDVGSAGLRAPHNVQLTGCSSTETRLVSASLDSAVVEVSDGRQLTLAGLTLSGGKRSLFIHDGATVTATDVTLEGGYLVGTVVHGKKSSLKITDFEVFNVQAVDNVGWGMAALDGGKIEASSGQIIGATEIGLFADDATVKMHAVDITNTRPTGRFGGKGRAVHVQSDSTLFIDGGTYAALLMDNTDAGIFAIDSRNVTVSGVVIDVTSAGVVIDVGSAGLTGDGIVIVRTPSAVVKDNVVKSSYRAAMLFEDSLVEVSGNDTSAGNGLNVGGYTSFTQHGGTVSGSDAGSVLDLGNPGLTLDTQLLDPSVVLE